MNPSEKLTDELKLFNDLALDTAVQSLQRDMQEGSRVDLVGKSLGDVIVRFHFSQTVPAHSEQTEDTWVTISPIDEEIAMELDRSEDNIETVDPEPHRQIADILSKIVLDKSFFADTVEFGEPWAIARVEPGTSGDNKTNDIQYPPIGAQSETLEQQDAPIYHMLEQRLQVLSENPELQEQDLLDRTERAQKLLDKVFEYVASDTFLQSGYYKAGNIYVNHDYAFRLHAGLNINGYEDQKVIRALFNEISHQLEEVQDRAIKFMMIGKRIPQQTRDNYMDQSVRLYAALVNLRRYIRD